jgi:integrase
MATAKDGVLVKPNTRSKRGGWIVDIRIKLPTSRESIRERSTVQAANKTEARNWGLRRREEILAQGGTTPPEQGREVPTLSVFKDRFLIEHMRAEQRKPSSINEFESVFRNHLGPRLGTLRLDEITVSEIQKLKGVLAESHQPKTINNILSALSSMLRRAVEWEVIASAPKVKSVKAPKPEVDFYDFNEYARLTDAARCLDPRIAVMVRLGGDAGLRRGEILALRWSDVDLKRQKLHVQRSKWFGRETAPKGGRDRWVSMTERLRAALLELPRDSGEVVLCREGGEPATAGVLHNWMRAAQRSAELPVTGNMHLLRHTFCSHLAMQNVPPKVIQSLAGHATLEMTMRYMHLVEGHDDAAIRMLDQRPTADASVFSETPRATPESSEVALENRGTSEALSAAARENLCAAA